MTRLISKIKNLIRAPMHRIGAYTQLDMNYLVRGGFWLTFGQVVGIGSSLIVAIAYANLLPKEAYGLYKYIMSVAGILGVFMLTGMLTPISRTVAKGKDTILAGAIRYQLRWSSIFVAISTAAAAYYWLQGNQTIAWSLLILAAGTPFIRSLNSFGSYLTGKKDFRLNTIIDTISGLFVAAAVIATISITNSVIALIGAYAASNLIANGAGYWVTIRKYPQATTTALDEDTKNFGKSLSVLGALGAIAQQLDKILVFKFSGTIELAIYSIASAMPDRMKSFLKTLVALSFPKLVAKEFTDIRSSLRLRVLQSMAIGGIAAGAYIAAAPIAFRYLFPEYQSAVFYSQIMALWLVFFVPLHYIGYIIHARKHVRTIYILESLTVAVRIGCYILFAVLWGIIGIVISRVVSIGLIFLAHLIMWDWEEPKQHRA